MRLIHFTGECHRPCFPCHSPANAALAYLCTCHFALAYLCTCHVALAYLSLCFQCSCILVYLLLCSYCIVVLHSCTQLYWREHLQNFAIVSSMFKYTSSMYVYAQHCLLSPSSQQLPLSVQPVSQSLPFNSSLRRTMTSPSNY